MRIKQEYKIRKIAGQNIVIMQGQHGADMTRVMSLNQTAAWLWEELQGRNFEEEEVAAKLFSRFNTELPTAIRDAREWIRTLKSHNILE